MQGDQSLPHLFIILLKCGEVLTGLGEFALYGLIRPCELSKEPNLTYLFHTLTDIPMHEGTLGVQKIELMVETAPGRRDSGCAKPSYSDQFHCCVNGTALTLRACKDCVRPWRYHHQECMKGARCKHRA